MDGIIAISSFLQQFYEQRNTPVICIPPLIDKSDKKWPNEEEVILNGIVRLAYVGNPGSGGKDKLDTIINAIAEIINKHPSLKVQFTIVGITKDLYLERFSFLPQKMDKVVFFMGRKSNMEALDIIKNSNFSIF